MRKKILKKAKNQKAKFAKLDKKAMIQIKGGGDPFIDVVPPTS